MTTFADIAQALGLLAPPEITVLVEPHRVADVEAQLEAAEFPACITVKGSPYVPSGQAIVINETEMRSAQDDAIRRMFGQRGEELLDGTAAEGSS